MSSAIIIVIAAVIEATIGDGAARIKSVAIH
jgi:hypothetical protein